MLHSLSRVSNSPSYHPRNEEFPHEQVVSYYAIYPSHHHLLRSSDVPLDVSICNYTVVKFVLEMYSSSEVHERLWLIQRATEKEQLKNAHDCHTFTLTKPFPALLRESSIAARSSSSTSTIHSECQQKGWTGL